MHTFWIERADDETMELFVGKRSVGSFCHDSHGWDGMKAAEDLFKSIAAATGATVKEK